MLIMGKVTPFVMHGVTVSASITPTALNRSSRHSARPALAPQRAVLDH